MKLSCHCGNISIEAPLPERLTTCNCSICSRYQALWGYYSPEQVRVVTGIRGESAYCWGDRELEFVRCGDCGCVTHYRTVPGQPDPRIAVNFRLVQDAALEGIPLRHFDGRNLL